MSFISPIATDTNGQPKTTGAQQVLGKDDFLQLLVTKLEYQDPLKPIDDEGFIAQLAQFSSLEQMNNIAEAISSSNQWDFLQTQSLNNVMAAGFIGKDVEADFSGVHVDADNKPNISFNISREAKDVAFEIRDKDDNLITTLHMQDVSAGNNSIHWDGKDSRGNRVEEGFYTVTASATGQDGSTFKPSLSLVGTVSSVVYRDGQALLIIDGTEVALSDVKTVGEPGTLSK